MWYCRKSHVLKKYIVYIQFILNNVMNLKIKFRQKNIILEESFRTRGARKILLEDILKKNKRG